MTSHIEHVAFGKILKPNKRPYTLGPSEDANLVGMRLYGSGPFHRELKPAMQIQKKTHFRIQAGDVIYNKLFAWKGTFGIVTNPLDGMFVSDKFPTYELDRTRVEERFLSWYFKHPPLWEQARQLSTGSAALSKLTLNPPRFMELTIPLPPPEEQRRVVALIEALVEKLDEVKELQKQSRMATRALLQSKLSHGLNADGISGTLSDVLTEKPRNGWSARCDNSPDGVPVLALSAVTGFVYDGNAHKRTSLHTNENAHYWLSTGDLLITRSNTPQLVGHAAIYDGTPSPCIFPDLMMRIPVDTSKANPRFVWYWLQTPLARNYVLSKATGTSPTMKKISQPIVMKIPYPSNLTLMRQAEIVEQLDRISVRIQKVESTQSKSRTAAQALLPSILDRAFKGEL